MSECVFVCINGQLHLPSLLALLFLCLLPDRHKCVCMRGIVCSCVCARACVRTYVRLYVCEWVYAHVCVYVHTSFSAIGIQCFVAQDLVTFATLVPVISSMQIDYGSAINFTCDTGYLLNGSSSVVCEATGSLSPAPFCERECC